MGGGGNKVALEYSKLWLTFSSLLDFLLWMEASKMNNTEYYS